MEPHQKGHMETIQNFGRFPFETIVLVVRETTDSEKRYLEQPEIQKRPY